MADAYIQTTTGEFSLTEVDSSSVAIRDIAQALSNMCRFTGHVKKFYSVAEHSVHCCRIAQHMCLSEQIQRECLMHDAHEAYIGDVSRPVKSLLGSKWEQLETNTWLAVAKRFSLPRSISIQTRNIDDRMLVTEAHLLQGGLRGSHWPDVESFTTLPALGMTPLEAKLAFLFEANRLDIK